MEHTARSALVLQGGGALGAYEYGAARALYERNDFRPDVIAGVSIGAIAAVLLARPARGRKPLDALKAFWEQVTVPGSLFPPGLHQYASFFGNRNFFVPRLDYFNWLTWTYLYDTTPLRHTLEQLVDLGELANKHATPRLLASATDVEEGQIRYFYSGDNGLTLDHILASGSLPPAFPMTAIDCHFYWDGGLFDNTPLGAVLDRLDKTMDVERTVYVVNLFPNKGSIPRNLLQVSSRMKNLQFANKTLEDVKMLRRFNEVAGLMEALEKLPGGNPLVGNPAYEAVKRRGYIHIPRIVSLPPPAEVDQFDDSDFSPEAMTKREEKGYLETKRVLSEENLGS
jgi:NTE family protein